MNNLKWYIIWWVTVKGWSVRHGKFRDSWYESKADDIARKDYLNSLDFIP